MAYRDGTGPQGLGPMTGRGMGNCAPGANAQSNFNGIGRGMSRGLGVGMGLGRGMGRRGLGLGIGRGQRFFGNAGVSTLQDEINFHKQALRQLENTQNASKDNSDETPTE